jgi:dolichol kinase
MEAPTRAAIAAPELAPLVARSSGLQPWRRVFHAANGLVLALTPGALGMSKTLVVALLALGSAALLAFDLVRLRAPSLNLLFFRLFPALVSPREAAGVASSTWYAVGALLVWGLFPAETAVAAILVLALADPAASFLGRRIQSPRFGAGSRFGSGVFLLVASVVLAPALGFPLALLAAAGVTLVEAVPWKLDDNLTVPLTAAALLTILGL